MQSIMVQLSCYTAATYLDQAKKELELNGGQRDMVVEFSELRTSKTLRISFRRRGFMFIEPDGYLALIYVRPSLRGRGNGNMMIKAAKTIFPNLYTLPVSSAGDSLIRKHNIPTRPFVS